MRFGITHTQVSVDLWHDAAVRERPELLLRTMVDIQNQHLMGWGALNPEPSPGVYDWESLDARMAIIERTGGAPVLTLCCAPDWMKGGSPGQTDWSKIDVAPLPDHYDDFASLAAAAALRYQQVEHFAVWNEMKGFYRDAENRWDAEGYTEFYNKVYVAVKAVRPDAKIGGPYVVLDGYGPDVDGPEGSGVTGPWGELDRRPLDVIDYWLARKIGADFLAVDGGIWNGGSAAPPSVAVGRFRAANEWLKSRTDLPIWWMEFYLDHPDVDTEEEYSTLVIEALDSLASSGAHVALLWDPNGSEKDQCGHCLWRDVEGTPQEGYPPLTAKLVDWMSE